LTSRIKIKAGTLEIEFEGSEEFLKTEFMDIVKTLSELHAMTATANTSDSPQANPDVAKPPLSSGSPLGTTSTIASKLSAKTGPDLAVAAAAHLTFVRGVDSFKRSELLEEMQRAKAYYKQNYSGNLTATLNGLVKTGRLTEVAKDTYALAADNAASLRGQLGLGT
jgi:hypothetical protein